TARPALRAQAPGEPPPVPTEDQINPPPPAPPRPGEAPPAPEGDVVPQQRGPVHEAFAVPADKAPVAGPVVPQPPPAPVPEELPYLPPPPESLEAGPTTPAPDDNSYYVPGCWLYRDTGYVWRPGCWAPCRPGWVWSPASYCATPSGYVFVDGYWDYPLDNRGLLFAPVCFNGTPWTNPGWCYRPSYCVGLGGLLSSLWVGPSRGCYFFGDHFGPRYRGLGFTPWYSYGRGYANPLFGYYRWANRGNPGWYSGLAGTYRGGRARASLVQPLGRLARGPSSRLAHVNASQFNHYRDSGQRFPAAGR